MDAEHRVNRLLEHCPESVQVLPAPLDHVVELQRSRIAVQRHLDPLRLIGRLPQGHVAGGLAHRQLAVLPLQAPRDRVVAQAAVVSAPGDGLVAHAQRPHGVGPDVHHPHVLAAEEALAAQDLRRAGEAFRVLLVGLLGAAVADGAQVGRRHQAGVARAHVEGEVQGVEEDVQGVQQAGHLQAEVLGFEVGLQTLGVERRLGGDLGGRRGLRRLSHLLFDLNKPAEQKKQARCPHYPAAYLSSAAHQSSVHSRIYWVRFVPLYEHAGIRLLQDFCGAILGLQ